MIEPFKHEYYTSCDKCGKKLNPQLCEWRAFKEIENHGWLVRISGIKREVLCDKCRRVNDKSN